MIAPLAWSCEPCDMAEADAERSKVRGALREATCHVHERLHQAPPFAAIANEQLSIQEYADLVERIATFHFTVEPKLKFGSSRRELIARDLRSLDRCRPEALPWSAPNNVWAQLGWTYVVEGSSLGGKVIHRQLDYLFGCSPEGRLFFAGSRSDVSRWQGVCREIEIHGQEFGARDEMIGGALAAFRLFEQLVVPSVTQRG